MKPMRSISAALSSSPTASQAKAPSRHGRRRKAARCRESPAQHLQQQRDAHSASTAATAQGRKAGPTPGSRHRKGSAQPPGQHAGNGQRAEGYQGLHGGREREELSISAIAQTMPDLTMMARRLAKSRSTKSSKALPVSSAGVQLFFSSASCQDLLLVAWSTLSVSAWR